MMHHIVESQMLYLVRGNRYQVFELEPLNHLLPPHNDVLLELFGVTAEQIIEGLKKLQYSMSQGYADAWMDMRKSYDEFCKAVDLGADPEEAIDNARDVVSPVVEKVFGETLNNISHVTGWDARLIDSLSLGIGECKTFFDDSEFSGWPIMELPTKKKPFIKIDGISYGFDYYSLFDNFYRALQKEIFRLKPEYVEYIFFASRRWNNDIMYDAKVLDIVCDSEKISCPEPGALPKEWAHENNKTWIKIQNINPSNKLINMFKIKSTGNLLKESISKGQCTFGYIVEINRKI